MQRPSQDFYRSRKTGGQASRIWGRSFVSKGIPVLGYSRSWVFQATSCRARCAGKRFQGFFPKSRPDKHKKEERAQPVQKEVPEVKVPTSPPAPRPEFDVSDGCQKIPFTTSFQDPDSWSR